MPFISLFWGTCSQPLNLPIDISNGGRLLSRVFLESFLEGIRKIEKLLSSLCKLPTLLLEFRKAICFSSSVALRALWPLSMILLLNFT